MGRKKKDKFKDKPLKEQIKTVFEKRFKEMLPLIDYENFISCIITPQRKSFRVNTLREDNPKQLIYNLKKKGLNISEVSWSKHSYYAD